MTNLYYRNIYECPCGCSWEGEWDSMCDDRCPTCSTSVSPKISTETGLMIALQAAVDLYNNCWEEVDAYGDQDTPDSCDRWADECFTLVHTYPDFYAVDDLEELGTAFRNLAEELRAESYGA